jgi:tRNA(fMet)-specific endonuclease VapC
MQGGEYPSLALRMTNINGLSGPIEALLFKSDELDTYSQRLNPNFENYPFDTLRNMGKNDLWIASLAALLGLTLVTTDADFDHLNNVFFGVRKIRPAEFIPFY